MKLTIIGPIVILPNNTLITPSQKGILNLPILLEKSGKEDIFSTLGKSLLSIALI